MSLFNKKRLHFYSWNRQSKQTANQLLRSLSCQTWVCWLLWDKAWPTYWFALQPILLTGPKGKCWIHSSPFWPMATRWSNANNLEPQLTWDTFQLLTLGSKMCHIKSTELPSPVLILKVWCKPTSDQRKRTALFLEVLCHAHNAHKHVWYHTPYWKCWTQQVILRTTWWPLPYISFFASLQ